MTVATAAIHCHRCRRTLKMLDFLLWNLAQTPYTCGFPADFTR